MVRARKDQKLTQRELGARVGTSQNIVSLIESGEVASSAYVLPICRVLKIPPPVHFQDEDDATWSQLGHLLRTKSMKKFQRALALVESMVEDEDEDAKPANDHTDGTRPRRRV
jgi:transcriptional regulator with XRE-family HTH domain